MLEVIPVAHNIYGAHSVRWDYDSLSIKNQTYSIWASLYSAPNFKDLLKSKARIEGAL